MVTSSIIGLYIVDSFLLAGICYLCLQNKNFHQFTKLPEPENNNNTAVISVAGPSFGSGKISVLLDETIAEVKPGDELQILSFDKTLRKCVCGTTSAISQRSQEEARS